ncbi:hypothetical protein E4U42_007571 [Claviceps africana]|uniref:Aminoglycoside phosphotransferase domain-containing protein n=1 Tax=Claviceps africana TaxID=83212 RepID=A0A8K0J0Y9_9HYPO|nr:hypothetical protein E4U42_007571 [Claviceps africana]
MATRNLLSGTVTLSAALANDRNMLHALQYPQQKEAFYKQLKSHGPLLADVVAHHLGTKSSEVHISPQEYWRHGSFNLCVPVVVDADPSARPRVPQYMTNPGNSDEKINCEAATYAWLRENCPTVPIPNLYGFGLSTNRRVRNYLLAALRFPQPSPYVSHFSSRFVGLDVGYLLIETIHSGKMLSETWDGHCKDIRRQQNLQRDLARIMISLAKISLPRIGSFRLDEKGYIRLDNRPLSIQFTMQENEGIPLGISRETTFSRVDDFFQAHLTAFENRLLHQPNGVRSYDDACYQMTGLVIAQTVLPRVFRKELNSGPFVYSLTDIHRSNIIVDDDWNVICMLDLEFACSLPVEFIHPPFWFDGQSVDQIDPHGYAPKHKGFVEHVKHEEQLQNSKRDGEPLSSIMQQSWDNGTFWLTHAVGHPISFEGLLFDQLLTHYFSMTSQDLHKIDQTFFARLWRRNTSSIIDLKLQDTEKYTEKLKEFFNETSSPVI